MRATRIILVLVWGAATIVLGALSFYLWMENRELSENLKSIPSVTMEYANRESGFFSTDLQPAYEGFLGERESLKSEKKDFIEADLDAMTITLYEGGEASSTFPIVSKGREGSWWETPSGLYSALTKETNHFSSIGHVWMPWSIQFYGNFFIHGWPYYEGGEPVPESYSGGCIRLESEDAEKIFAFSERNMPILVLDRESKPLLREALRAADPALPVPEISAEAAFAADLESGEVFLNKRAEDALPVASLTKLMTATVAGELIYLERSVQISADMLRDEIQSYDLREGQWYKTFDLLYPLLTRSSNGAARALAGFFGETYFVRQMNRKADTLGMYKTHFVDPAGVEGGNVSSLADMARLARYIAEKRQFIFDITKGEIFKAFGIPGVSLDKNFNEFHEDGNLIGMKNGESSTARQTLLGVWSMQAPDGQEHTVLIGVLGSKDRRADTEAIRDWLSHAFSLE